MNDLVVRELIKLKLDSMSEDQLTDILDYITRVLLPIEIDDYDESRDMTIGIIKDLTNGGQRTKGRFTDKSETGGNALVGFISGPKDVAEHTKEILWAEFGLKKADED